ncbi:peptidoglycan recognition protein 3-like [Saccoglossus kowalevskii]
MNCQLLLILCFAVAAYADSGCNNKGGTCQDDSLYCDGHYESGLCNGDSDRRCCVPDNTDAACEAEGGTCQDDSIACSGWYESGLCDGGYDRRCCVPPGVEVYCGEVRLITREQWGARPPNGKWYMSLPVDLSFIHHTVGSHCYDIETCCEVMRATQNYHMDSLGWSDIGYSFLIGEDGNAYEGRGWGVIGAHTSGYNDVSHGISFMGTYTTDPYHLLFAVGLPTYNMLKYTVLVVCLIVTVYGDWACRREQGTCQNDSLQCEGHYESRLCNGDVRRRCCVPNSDGEIEAVYCGNVRLITRQQWRARSPRRESHMSVPVGLTFIHHTAGRTCYSIATCSSRARAVQNYHMNIKGWKDIGYSFLIGQDGNAYEGRGWGVVGAHTYGFNSRSHGIAFMGNFNSRKPNAAALQAAKNLIQCGIDENKIKSNYFLYGHRDVKRTECPGRALYQEIKSWPN